LRLRLHPLLIGADAYRDQQTKRKLKMLSRQTKSIEFIRELTLDEAEVVSGGGDDAGGGDDDVGRDGGHRRPARRESTADDAINRLIASAKQRTIL
jgi:hypothetical protein